MPLPPQTRPIRAAPPQAAAKTTPPPQNTDNIPRSFPINGNAASMLQRLEKLGRLPEDFCGEDLLPLLAHDNEKIRYMAAKNLGKTENIQFLKPLYSVATSDTSTTVRREAVSAIGRMRNSAAIRNLAKLTRDRDPKVVLQALRGLLKFKKKTTAIQEAIENLRRHPNEMVQAIVERERLYEFDAPESRKFQIDAPEFMKNTVVQGDVLSVLKKTPAESVHLTFTSPPYYNARDYSIYPSYADYLGFLQKVFRQVHRITKAGRFFVLNTSPIIIPRPERQHSSRRYPIPFDLHPLLTKMGWEFIDDIVWKKPEASVKNRNGGFFQYRKPLAYKPNSCTEYLMVYRKKTPRLIDWNIKQYGQVRTEKSLVKDGYETSNVWNIDPVWDKKHSATFPTQLCKRVIQYYSFADDLIFDPFGGSGTVGVTAAALGRYFFMTEIAAEYIARMKERFSAPGLFVSDINFIDEARFSAFAKEERQK